MEEMGAIYVHHENGTSIGGLLRRNEHTIFRDAIFPDACRADVVGNRRGQKNTTHFQTEAHDFSRRDFSRCLRADVVGKRFFGETPSQKNWTSGLDHHV
jgi:hypothetical protein